MKGLDGRWAVTAWAATVALGCGVSQEHTVTSPNGRVAVTLAMRDGVPHYGVRHDGQPVIAPSKLGLRLAGDDVRGATWDIRSVSREAVHLNWEPVWGTASQIEDRHEELSVTLGERRANGGSVVLRFRAYDEGAAFRYEIPEQEGHGALEIAGEDTEVRFPEDGRAFVLSRTGFEDSYEGPFDPLRLSQIPEDTLIGMPLLVEGDGHWVAVTEAALVDYAGMSLRRDPSDPLRMTAALAPAPNGEGPSVRGEAPLVTPWRTFLVAERAGDLMESHLIWNLNEPNAIEDPSWIRTGQAIWPWWNNRIVSDPSVQGGRPSTAVMKHYTDFAARHGIPHLVVDAGWYSIEADAWNQPEKEDVLTMEETRASFYDIHEVLDYGREKGVAVHLWVHLASLRGRVEEVLEAYAEWGAAGIKLDNYGGDDQGTVEDLLHVVRVAAQHGLTVDYHGAYKPTGLGRTWPNFLTREGVLGLEWSKGRPIPTTEHNVTLPYTRMITGAMDYTPGAFDLDGAPGFPKHVQGTRAHQVAMLVVYFSPFQMLVDYPAAYESSPEQFAFVLGVPTTWDETRFLEGEPGDYVAVARRKGDVWHVGAMTDENPRALSLALDFLEGDQTWEALVLRDGDAAGDDPQDVALETQTVKATDRLELELAGGGGTAVRLSPADPAIQ